MTSVPDGETAQRQTDNDKSYIVNWTGKVQKPLIKGRATFQITPMAKKENSWLSVDKIGDVQNPTNKGKGKLRFPSKASENKVGCTPVKSV